MIRFIVPGFLDGHDPIVAERWYYRFHGKEIVHAIGPWLRRYETYKTLPPPPRADRLGARGGFLTELWYGGLDDYFEAEPYNRNFTPVSPLPPGVEPGEPCYIMCPARPTEDFLGKEPAPEEVTILRWVCVFKYPKGVSLEEGERWYLDTHAQEAKKQPGLLRYVSHRRLEHPELGGGSCMDVGKVAWVLYEHPDLASWPVADLAGAVGSRELRTKARYVAIPTTSGSASEVSGAAIFIDWEVHPPLKTGVFSEQLVPDVAILDPELTLTMPPTVTADCGYDALIHAVEGYVTSIDHPSEMRDTFALRAANTIFECLPRAVADGRDLQAREKIHLASLQAGMAMQGGTLATTTAATGPGEQSGPRWPPAPIHVPSHAMGAAFRIPHGRANAFLLCPVFAFLYPTHKARLCSLATSLGIAGEDDRTQISNLLDALDQLKQKVGIPLSIRDSGVDETRWLEQVDLLATDTCSRSGAADIGLSIDELKEIYLHA